MKFEVHPVPATEPPMARLQDTENPDAWIAADERAFISPTEATDEEVRQAIEAAENGGDSE